jgi:NADPH2:quinone reductase
VLRVGEMPTPEPSRGEVRIRVEASGIHSGDLGKRRGWWGSTMAFPRVIPHGDGAGVIDRVGPDVADGRLGERVWTYLAQSYRPFGTAAEYVVVPATRAVPLPAEVAFEQAACLGIPGITAHRAVFADGPVSGSTIVIAGALGAVGRAAVALARRGGATVIATVRIAAQLEDAATIGAHHVVHGSSDHLADRILACTGGSEVDRVAEVAFDANIDTDLQILKIGGVIATYASGSDRPDLPFWQLGFKNVTIHFLSNDDFLEPANQAAAAALTDAVAAGDLRYPIAARFPLEQIAEAHETAERLGARGRVVVLPQTHEPANADETRQ